MYTIDQWVNDPDFDGTADIELLQYPFKVRVAVVKDRPPRHPAFEYLLNIGSGNIDRVFDNLPIRGSVLEFFMPERFMSVQEQQLFVMALAKHPDAATWERVDIITSSPIIITNFTRNQIRIVTWNT